MKPRVLLVDDDENLLNGVRRQLHGEFDLSIAAGPREGLNLIRNKGQFDVIVSDMQMPVMSGVDFLAWSGEFAPDAARIMLTGNADQKTAVDAVNSGGVLRFLNKPCTREELVAAIRDGAEAHARTVANRELADHAVASVVRVLIELLRSVCPRIYSFSGRVRKIVHTVAMSDPSSEAALCDLASSLFPVGALTLRQDDPTGDLAPSEAARLLKGTPKLEEISECIALQDARFDSGRLPYPARLLKVAIDLQRLLDRGLTPTEALGEMHTHGGAYDPALLDLAAARLLGAPDEPTTVGLSDLRAGMRILRNLEDDSGSVLLPPGFVLTRECIDKLRCRSRLNKVREPIVVLPAAVP